MKAIKGIEELKEQLAAFEQDITASIAEELKRVSRTVSMDEFRFVPFNNEVADYIDAIRLDENGEVILDTSFNDVLVKSLSAFISDNEIDHWDMIALLELLKNTPTVKIKTYTLQGKDRRDDVSFTINDLIPVIKSKKYDYDQLVKLINHRDYDSDWAQPMKEEYDLLYSKDENQQVDFFKIRGTEIIVMPGLYIYPTILSENDIKNNF
jgi:hypothetical protein